MELSREPRPPPAPEARPMGADQTGARYYHRTATVPAAVRAARRWPTRKASLKSTNCDGQQASGQRSAGQRSAGQRSAGQRSAGQRSAGQRSAGQRSAGQRSAGQRSAGQLASCSNSPSGTPRHVGVESGLAVRGHGERRTGRRRQQRKPAMSTVTTSPEITVGRRPSRLTSTLPRTTVSVGVLAAAVTTAGAVALRAAASPAGRTRQDPTRRLRPDHLHRRRHRRCAPRLAEPPQLCPTSAVRPDNRRPHGDLLRPPGGVRRHDRQQGRPGWTAPGRRGDHCSGARTTRRLTRKPIRCQRSDQHAAIPDLRAGTTKRSKSTSPPPTRSAASPRWTRSTTSCNGQAPGCSPPACTPHLRPRSCDPPEAMYR